MHPHAGSGSSPSSAGGGVSLGGGSISSPGRAGSAGNSGDTGVTVTGVGSAPAAVDHVTVTLGVEILRPDAGDAFRVAAASADAVLGVLSDHGVDSRSVRTADLTLGPRYEHHEGRQALVGYQAVQRLVVTVPGLSTIDRMLTDLVGRAGEGLRIEQVSLTAGSPREAESDARAAAMIDAREKATTLAALAGRPLGQVVRVAEQPANGARPVALMAYRTAESASMPIATGDTTVTVCVSVQFAWAD